MNGGIIPRYRPILKNESVSLPLIRPGAVGGHPGVPRPHPYMMKYHQPLVRRCQLKYNEYHNNNMYPVIIHHQHIMLQR